MSIINSFEEIMKNMINPLDNPDFFAMIMAQRGGKYSLSHGYYLGQNTIADWIDLWNFVFDEYFKNVKTEENENIMHLIRESKKNGGKLSIDELKKHDLDKILGTCIDISVPTDNSIWFYFSSKNINPNLSTEHIPSKEVRHRLYLTIDARNRVEMAKKIVEKCTLKGLPYRFKISYSKYKRQENMQSDTMVMYLSEEQQVVEYVNIINEIFEENPKLKDSAHKVSPHLGMIGDYIGYGFEPKLDNSMKTSYSVLLEKMLGKINLKKMALDIFSRLSEDSESILQKEIVDPTKALTSKPNSINSLKLEDKVEYRRIRDLLYCYLYDKKQPEIRTEDVEKIKTYLSNYFRLNGMQCNEIKEIKLHIYSQICQEYPRLLEDKNMYGLVNYAKQLKQQILPSQNGNADALYGVRYGEPTIENNQTLEEKKMGSRR